MPATISISEPQQPTPKTEEPDEPRPARRPSTPGADLPGPPQIIRVELLGESLLRLHFSEPLAPIEGFDPNDFRLSFFSVYANQRAGYAYAYYYDFGYQLYGQSLRFTDARLSQTKLDLSFTPSVNLSYCRQFNSSPDYSQPGIRSDTGLFLHYAAGAIPIHDQGGASLANFGADWVIAGRSDPPQTRRDVGQTKGATAGQNLIRVQCGAELPEGPR